MQLELHYQLVKDPNDLKPLLDRYPIGKYTIEMRRKKYVIKAETAVDKGALVSRIITYV